MQARLNNLLQSRLVRCLPDFGQSDGAVEAMENAQRQSDALDHHPRYVSVELELHLFTTNGNYSIRFRLNNIN